jgi:glycosyltransferase involved in cell wall biosynthesis
MINMVADEKYNILEIVDSFGYAGTQRAAINFCRYLDRNFFNIYACAYCMGGPRTQELAEMGVDYLVANDGVEKIIKYILDHKVGIIHFHRSGHFVPIQYEILKRAKEEKPNLVIIETNVFGKYDKKTYDLIDCSLQISKMMCNERYVKKTGFFDFKKIRVLYYPIDFISFEKLLPTEHEIKKFKEEIGIKPGDFVIGKLGRPHIAKWSDLLIDMMPYLVKLVPNIRFIVMAIPESRKKRILSSEYRNNYILLDETSDDRKIALFYSTIDVYVHASKIGESFGMTLAEAAIFKKPVVVNSTPKKDNNQLELINHMETGIFANSPQTFARAVEFLYKNHDLRKGMGNKAYLKVFRDYNAVDTTKQLEKIVIEQIFKKGIEVGRELLNYYNRLSFFPSEKDILDYKKEYKKRLTWDFGTLSAGEKVVNFLNKPKKLYWKIRDFAEHRFGDIFGK